MPRTSIYVTDGLYARIKAHGASFNMSAVCQVALREALDLLESTDTIVLCVNCGKEFHTLNNHHYCTAECRELYRKQRKAALHQQLREHRAKVLQEIEAL